MKKYTPKLVEGTDDQYKIYTDNRGTMLCGDQMGEEFVKLHLVWDAIERCEGDIDYLKHMLPKDSFKEEPALKPGPLDALINETKGEENGKN